ncbi:hypothetical protein [Mariniradius sediminis]|uniref:Outer membrane lipoprotein-sorting protein n=1 Tax=Mariniradius sediminis TaxID=2909237 RepID=A0ABS9BW58_9BACT|nr:hypothetical protein [Mariniradius sediminis]MCF1751677.1 hypothetical protein [Mariniradius sediminis]
MSSSQLFSKSIPSLLICIALISCKPSAERKAIELISKSIDAHGGYKEWKAMESMTFLKETRLYHADSSLENELFQEIEIRFQPHLEIRMNWEKDSMRHTALFDGKRTRYWLGENEIQNEDFLKSKKRDLDAAAYVMTKPFDLLTGDKQIEYKGLVLLPDGKEYESVRVVDGPHSSSNADIWVYYFNPSDSRLTAYSVKTLDHTSLVFNDGWDVFGGLILPLRRKSYRLLESGEIEYLRAEYEFSEYHINR